MRYDDNHKERTRARVLAEAAAAIRSKGAERVGVAEVMAGAGLTHGGFYAHFKSKDDLVTEAVTYSNVAPPRSGPRMSDRGSGG
jgi:TetR/AcrR family transcriptional repressor of nem operon